MTLPQTGLICSILALGAAATSPVATPAFADGPRPVSVEFAYDPDASAATNYRNLLVKVKRACTQQGPRSIAYMPKEKACIEGMTNLVVAQVDRPEVNVAHAAATGAGRRELAAQ
jgi:hypothetical protein